MPRCGACHLLGVLGREDYWGAKRLASSASPLWATAVLDSLPLWERLWRCNATAAEPAAERRWSSSHAVCLQLVGQTSCIHVRSSKACQILAARVAMSTVSSSTLSVLPSYSFTCYLHIPTPSLEPLSGE